MHGEGSPSRYRLTTTAADKASVFTEFMAEAREEEEAAGRGRRRRARGGRDVGLSFHCWRGKKMTRGNGTIMAPTGIRVHRPENMERPFLRVLREDSGTVYVTKGETV